MKKIIPILLSAIVSASCCNMEKWQQTSQSCVNRLAKNAPFAMKVSLPQFPDRTLSVMDFGAVNDGTALTTEAIQSAIDNASERGGGTVLIPDGVYLTGPIVLKSNVRLYAAHNALVIFSPDFSLYPVREASFEGLDTRRCQSPISAYNAENIAICGSGTFDGSGDAWRPVKKAKLTDSQWKKKLASGGVVSADGKVWYPDSASIYAHSLCEDQNVPVGLTTDEEWNSIRSFLRPVMLNFINCKNILLEGVCFENSPAWNLHPLMCENLVMSNLTVRNPWYSQNGDGVDVESCKNVIITRCSFDVGDDAICMKSGKNEDGRRRGIPAENILVDRCTVYHGHGGFVVGSEMSGGVRNIAVSNCLFIGTDVGLRFKSTRGRGGIVENIFIENVCMNNIPNEALLFDLFYGGKGAGEETDEEIAARMAAAIPQVDETTPQFRNITISNVICDGAKRAIYFNGLPEMPIQNVALRNIRITATEGATFNKTENITLDDVYVNGEQIL
ncbi:MAG: glycoside hydrolase family 28 protein [Paludibacteraceae bacterium]|nr:glycoside hydrolase family 28 protein [Paludibacteraceae bacterium]